jgi:competence ComEA-like helix-hairpin-helix protein
MAALRKPEKYIIVFLSFSLIAGLGLGISRQHAGPLRVELGKYSETDPVLERRGAAAQGARLNINRATLEELMRLKGVGRVTAQRILEYRVSHGAFSSPEELKKVKGLSRKIVSDNLDKITVRDEQ